MATAGSPGSLLSLRWKPLTQTGPHLAHHVGCIIRGALYIHGGIDKRLSTHPLNGLHRLDLSASTWQSIDASNSPALSHHCCVALHDRYMLLIGGWDGKARLSDIYAFDTQENRWIFPKSSGFPIGAGLSSHTATLLSDGNILIVGREGSLRMQRRSGSAFLLSGNITKGTFRYSDYGMGVASRSGHTANIVGTTLYIIGGRSDNVVELHSGYNGMGNTPPMMASIAAKAKTLTPMLKPPCGRKNHIAVSGPGLILIHGGETFDGRSREPVGEAYLLQTKPHIQWVKAAVSEIGRAGHVCCSGREKVVLHGGEGAKGVIYGDAYQLEVL